MPEDRPSGPNNLSTPNELSSTDNLPIEWQPQSSAEVQRTDGLDPLSGNGADDNNQGQSVDQPVAISEPDETTMASSREVPQESDIVSFDREPATAGTLDSTIPPVPGFSQSSPIQPVAASKSKKGLVAAITAGIVVLLAGGAAAAYNVWYQNPDKVIGDAIGNILTSKSASTDSVMTIDSGSGETSSTFEIRAKTVNDLKNMRADMSLSGDMNSTRFDMAGSVMVKDAQQMYFKIDKLKELLEQTGLQQMFLGSTPSTNRLIEKLDGRWVMVDQKDIDETTGTKSKTTQCVEDTFMKLRTDSSYSNEMEKLYKESPLVGVKQKLGSKDGSLGYEIEFSRDNAVKFANGVNSTQFYKDLKKCDGSIKDLDGDKMFKEEQNSKGESKFIVWVDRWSHQFTKFELSSKSEDSSGSVIVSTQFNVPVSIDAPKNALTMDELKEDVEAIQQESMKANQASELEAYRLNEQMNNQGASTRT
ncbi:hypothetical protein [Dokdonella sp.]|uniref:hypothetical protein n=1 Tax=Dokdonella sp. TaxID=2291710 RepID=UPI0031C44736|nr:hypothetical protein [Dokdonella sp.]